MPTLDGPQDADFRVGWRWSRAAPEAMAVVSVRLGAAGVTVYAGAGRTLPRLRHERSTWHASPALAALAAFPDHCAYPADRG